MVAMTEAITTDLERKTKLDIVQMEFYLSHQFKPQNGSCDLGQRLCNAAARAGSWVELLAS